MFWLHVLARVARDPKLRDLVVRLGRLPESRLALLVELHRSLPAGQVGAGLAAGVIKNIVDNPVAAEWLVRIAERLSDRCLRTFFENFLINEVVQGQLRRREFFAEEGFEAPVTLVINPTTACNLECRGCYAYKMPRASTPYPLLRRVLGEARDMGARYITISGGEPLLYRHLFRMLDEFGDLSFMAYTNGTLIDEAMADRIAAAGNLWPAISVEGFREHTDARRGAGVHDRIMRAMRLLRERGVMFGYSATPTRRNSEVISSDAFIDFYLEHGVLFGWLFQYVPLGKDPDLGLMATPEQRDRLRAQTKHWQLTRPLFIGDFWNDGACVGGCLSATRYCYITSAGLVQPCTFVHFYTHDLNHCTLRDVFRSPFFRAIRSMQPYDRNLLRPCKVIDHPELLRRVVRETGARPTYPGAEAIIEDPAVRAHLDRYAARWGELADAAWAGPMYDSGRSVLTPFLGRIDVHEHYYSMRVSRAERIRAEGARAGGAAASPAVRAPGCLAAKKVP